MTSDEIKASGLDPTPGLGFHDVDNNFSSSNSLGY